MAVSAPRVCSAPGCYRTAQGSPRCPLHPYEPRPRKRTDRDREYDRMRGSASSRGYDWTWHKLRNAVLQGSPLCVRCEKQGRTRAAEEVDHIQPISTHPELRLVRENLQPLCLPCHRLKTALDKRDARMRARGLRLRHQ